MLLSALVSMTLLSSPPAAPTEKEPFLRAYAETRRFLAGRPVAAKPTPDGAEVLFLRAKARAPEQTLYAFDLKTGQTRELLTPQAVLQGAAETLSAAEKARLERMRVTARGFTSYQMSEDGAKLLVALSGKLYVVERVSGKVTQLKTGEGPAIDPRFSPDGTKVAYVRANDVRVIDLANNRERTVTRAGSEVVTHGLAEFVAQEEMGRFSGYWWSPDSKWIAFEEADHSKVERFAIADPMHPERVADQFFYPRPGKENVRVRVGVASVAGGAPTWLHWDAAAYPYLATVKWPKAGPLTLLVQNRTQTESLLLAADARTGRTRTLLVEKDDAWLNLDQDFPKWLEDGSAFLWHTERNGGPEVELRAANGELKASWVKPADGFDALVGFDEKTRTLYFSGGPNPTTRELYRVKEGGAAERLPFDGKPANRVAQLSKDGAMLVVTTTALDQMPKTTVHRIDGARVGELPSVAEEPSIGANVEIRKVGKGDGYWAAIVRPEGFQKGRKLPVLVQVYGGPHHQEVVHTRRENLLLQWMANQGYLVVKFDGRGTPRRGRAWERAIKNDFATLTLEDQVTALQALAQELPELDLTRVGVYGWSFGGYMAALAVLQRPDVFKSAVAGAPVVDWLDYDTHYTERYLGLPQDNARGYRQSNLLTHAEKLKRPLLLIHGTADDNVYFFHALKLSDALFRAGKPHDFLPLSNFTHMVPEPLVTERLWQRIAHQFKETL